jgi:hypothetical protein
VIRPGNGIGHPAYMQRFGKPGDTLIGSDSRTAAAVNVTFCPPASDKRQPIVHLSLRGGQKVPWV